MAAAIKVGWLQAVKEAIRLYGLYPNNRLCPPQRVTTSAQSDAVRTALEKVFGPIEPMAV